MGVWDFDSLAQHRGHEIECVFYGDEDNAVNVAVECITCGSVLLDYDRVPDPQKEKEEYLFTEFPKIAATLKKLEDLTIALSLFEFNMKRWITQSARRVEDPELLKDLALNTGIRAGLAMAWDAYYEAYELHYWDPGEDDDSTKNS